MIGAPFQVQRSRQWAADSAFDPLRPLDFPSVGSHMLINLMMSWFQNRAQAGGMSRAADKAAAKECFLSIVRGIAPGQWRLSLFLAGTKREDGDYMPWPLLQQGEDHVFLSVCDGNIDVSPILRNHPQHSDHLQLHLEVDQLPLEEFVLLACTYKPGGAELSVQISWQLGDRLEACLKGHLAGDPAFATDHIIVEEAKALSFISLGARQRSCVAYCMSGQIQAQCAPHLSFALDAVKVFSERNEGHP